MSEEQNGMLSGRFDALRRWTDRILWWSAGTVPTVVGNLSRQERLKYVSIGVAVLTSTLLAFLGLSYVLRIAGANFVIALLAAVIWAALLFVTDRHILSTMITKGAAGYTAQFLRILPRMLLMAFFVFVSAYPLVLVVFANAIDRRLEIQNTATVREIDEQIAALEADTKSLREQLQTMTADVNEKLNSYLDEVRGLKGTGRIGIGRVATIKRKIYEHADLELKQQQVQLEAQMRANAGRVAALQSRKEQLLRDRNSRSTNLIARLDALAVLRQQSSALRRIQYLVLGIVILIEMAPFLLKLLAPTDLYEYVVDHENDDVAIRQMRELQERTERTAETMQRAFAAALDESGLNPSRQEVRSHGNR